MASATPTDAYPLDGLKYIQGDPVDLKTARGSKVIVLELWATWCPPCKTSIPHLSALQAKYKDRGVVFVGVSEEDESTVTKFVSSMGSKMAYTVAIDPSGVLNSYNTKFKPRGIPHAFVIDKNGKVTWSGHPMESGLETSITTAVAASSTTASATPATETKTEEKAPDLRGKTRDEVNALPVKDLKAALRAKAIDFTGLLEKSEIVAKVMESCV